MVDVMTDVNQELLEALQRLCSAKRPLEWSPSTELAEAFAHARATITIARAQDQGMSRCLDCGIISPSENLNETIEITPRSAERVFSCPACGSDNI